MATNTRFVSAGAATAVLADLQRGSTLVKQVTVLTDSGAYLPVVVLGDVGQTRMRAFAERHRGETISRRQGSYRWDFTICPGATERSVASLTLTSREILQEFTFTVFLNLASDRAFLESLAMSGRLVIALNPVKTSIEARLSGVTWLISGAELLAVLAQN